jgi:hypothetical protein
VRMRRDGEGYDVRFRAEQRGMAREIKQRAPQLRRAASQRGVAVAQIDVQGDEPSGGTR